MSFRDSLKLKADAILGAVDEFEAELALIPEGASDDDRDAVNQLRSGLVSQLYARTYQLDDDHDDDLGDDDDASKPTAEAAPDDGSGATEEPSAEDPPAVDDGLIRYTSAQINEYGWEKRYPELVTAIQNGTARLQD